jgi:hypothetical protein
VPAGPRHGLAAPSGAGPLPGAGGGRYGRLFGHLPRRDAGPEATAALARGLADPATPHTSSDNTRMPAGYTYLGQFVDHDITFDATSRLERDNDPAALVDFRTPRLDLDSLYGAGPADQPYLYDWNEPLPGARLLVGGGPSGPADLPRNAQDRALIGDGRNDEHLIIAQLHLLFVRFHNQVVRWLAGRDDAPAQDALLEEAQRVVRWHYQWIVRHDFLPRVVGRPLPAVPRRFFTGHAEPFIPVEFSAAAFRFGHSMVRDAYRLGAAPPPLPIVGDPADPGAASLDGHCVLPAAQVIQWGRFFFALDDAPEDRVLSRRIDPLVAAPLHRLPPDGASLADLNLRRGRALGLPAGADVARAMDVTPLSDAQLRSQLPPLGDATVADALVRATPLWFYILTEAHVMGNGGLHLGPVGGGIVAEVLAGLLEDDPRSHVNQWPAWRPELPGAGGTTTGEFTMTDLVAFTERGEGATPP